MSALMVHLRKGGNFKSSAKQRLFHAKHDENHPVLFCNICVCLLSVFQKSDFLSELLINDMLLAK